jgi:hypothetical protein
MCLLVVCAYGHWGEEGWHLPEGGTSSSCLSVRSYKEPGESSLSFSNNLLSGSPGSGGQMSSFPQ